MHLYVHRTTSAAMLTLSSFLISLLFLFSFLPPRYKSLPRLVRERVLPCCDLRCLRKMLHASVLWVPAVLQVSITARVSVLSICPSRHREQKGHNAQSDSFVHSLQHQQKGLTLLLFFFFPPSPGEKKKRLGAVHCERWDRRKKERKIKGRMSALARIKEKNNQFIPYENFLGASFFSSASKRERGRVFKRWLRDEGRARGDTFRVALPPTRCLNIHTHT